MEEPDRRAIFVKGPVFVVAYSKTCHAHLAIYRRLVSMKKQEFKRQNRLTTLWQVPENSRKGPQRVFSDLYPVPDWSKFSNQETGLLIPINYYCCKTKNRVSIWSGHVWQARQVKTEKLEEKRKVKKWNVIFGNPWDNEKTWPTWHFEEDLSASKDSRKSVTLDWLFTAG